ncbi:MAG: hypothetical protein ABI237_15485 [Ginsengibacter sp.]
MEKVQILSIGRDAEWLQKISRFINENPGWESTATIDDETAIKIFHQRRFEVVLFIDTIEGESEKKLRSIFLFHEPDIVFVQHNGVETGLLASEIREAIDNRNYTRNNIIDDVFEKNEDE